MIPEKFLEGLKTQDLIKLIKKETTKANKRIEELKKEKLYDVNSRVAQKWNAVLHDKNYSTKSGKFSKKVIGVSKKDLIKKYVAVKSFNEDKTSVEETKAMRKKAADALGFDDEEAAEEVIEQAAKLYKRYGLEKYQDSDIILRIITNRYLGGQSKQTIQNAINKALKRSTTVQDFVDNLARGRTSTQWL